MKPTAAPPNNPKRYARILLWAALWLGWVSEHLGGVFSRFRATRALTQSLNEHLNYMSRVIACSLLMQAAARTQTQRRGCGRFYGPRKMPGALTRAMIGSAVRKMMRARSPQQRAALLVAILKNPEPIVRLLMKRIENNLTRLTRDLRAQLVTHTHGWASATILGLMGACASLIAWADTS